MTLLRGKKKTKTLYAKFNSSLWVGWKTYDISSQPGINQALLTAMGVKEGDELGLLPAGTVAILAPNSPKLPRIRIPLSSGPQAYLTTFCQSFDLMSAADKGALRTANASVVSGGNSQNYAATKFRETVFVNIGTGLFYYTKIEKTLVTAFATTLGLEKLASATDLIKNNAFSGTTFPSPARVSIQDPNSPNSQTVTLPCSTDKLEDAIAAGFKVVERERLSF